MPDGNSMKTAVISQRFTDLLQQARQESAALSENAGKAEESSRALKAENASLREQLKDEQLRSAEFKGQTTALQAHVDTLKKQLDNLSKALSAAQAAKATPKAKRPGQLIFDVKTDAAGDIRQIVAREN